MFKLFYVYSSGILLQYYLPLGHCACINLIFLYPYPPPPPPAEDLLFLLIPEDWLKLHSSLKTSRTFVFTPEEYGSTLKNFVKIKASPPKNSIVFYSTPKKSSIFRTYPWRIAFFNQGRWGYYERYSSSPSWL